MSSRSHTVQMDSFKVGGSQRPSMPSLSGNKSLSIMELHKLLWTLTRLIATDGISPEFRSYTRLFISLKISCQPL